MDYQTFSSLYLSNLSIPAIYSLIKSTIEMTQPVLPELNPISVAALTQLEIAQENLGSSMNKSQKSALTPEIKALDTSRDGDIKEINRVTRTYLKSSNESKKSAASTLQLFLTPYKGIDRQPINIETGSVVDFISKYKSKPELIAAATTLEIQDFFTTLETKNNRHYID
jgi:hypothetical protein